MASSPIAIQEKDGCPVEDVAEQTRRRLAPATQCLREWVRYIIEVPGADRLTVGSRSVGPITGCAFEVKFENQLGLANLQPMCGGCPTCAPLWVEVLSPKFPTQEQHLGFYQATLDDLFARAARLPFTISGDTARGVTEALRPPTSIFTLYFLTHHCDELASALRLIQCAPHRVLHQREERVPMWEAAHVDGDVLLRILQDTEELVRTDAVAVAEHLNGMAPARVWQHLPEETFDTPENRFIASFARTLLIAAEALQSQRWWPNVPETRRGTIKQTSALVREALRQVPLDGVGRMVHFPGSSQVLLRREGYRDMRRLWQLFNQARRPLFDRWQQAMDVRDIATLYEVWCFFALVEEIAAITGEDAVLELELSDDAGLGRRSTASFGDMGKLWYNKGWRGYSGMLRPDFTWMPKQGRMVALDAKFRMEHSQALAAEDDEGTAEAVAKRSDIYKMHTYRDALFHRKVRAAVALYPGDRSEFHNALTRSHGPRTLRELLSDDALEGVGAIPLSPVGAIEDDENG